MTQLTLIDFVHLAAQPHPHLTGIDTQMTAITLDTHPAIDALIAHIPPGGTIPLHQHPDTCEIACVLSASGLAVLGEENSPGQPVAAGCALFIAAGVAHSITNTSAETMRIFAVHTLMKGAHHA
jgi:quercetin dioxygenase-like cupin family protein